MSFHDAGTQWSRMLQEDERFDEVLDREDRIREHGPWLDEPQELSEFEGVDDE